MGKHKELSTEERNKVVQFILESCKNGKPGRGKFQEASLKFMITRQTVSRYWKSAKQQQARGLAISSVSKKKGMPPRILKPFDPTLMKSIHLNQRGDLRSIAVQMLVCKSTVHRWYKAGLLRAHTSAIKPDLTQANKLLRLTFSLQALELDRILNKLRFSNMHNDVHIDEKWFHITKGKHRFYLVADEEDPHRTCKNKNYIGKIMFVCAVSRPLIANNGEVLFDGKIGIFPFIDRARALRKSKHRERGTYYTKVIESITREVMKDYLINKIVPAIMHKWPRGACKNIRIQQDNAKPHIKNNDPDFREAATKNGFNINLVQQPPNSPDCNVLDLGFFRAIQSLQHETACKTIDDLVRVVQEAFYILSPQTLNKVFLSLQGCLIEILKVRGQNSYKLPHMGKDALLRTGDLPTNLEVPMELAKECINFLVDSGQIRGIAELGDRLGIQESFGLLEQFGLLGI